MTSEARVETDDQTKQAGIETQTQTTNDIGTASEAGSEDAWRRPVAKPTAPAKQSGFLYHFGPQAWIDMFMSNSMIVKKAGPLIPYTFLPILRMTTDRERIDREWAEMRSRREKTRFFDSPRERWRKNYGNFVREVEWALLELRKHFSQEQYEEIVVGTSVALAHENSASFLEMMNSISDTKPAKNTSEGPVQPSGVQKLLFDMFNPAGFLTGPAEVASLDAARGEMLMEIPDCAWHICAKAESLPNPDALPEQGCLLICKGAFEELFKGEGGGLKVEFEPHLPETSCSVRMSWKAD
jgi:hypothetical protein